VNIDTGTFSAITAETTMLREHSRRAAPGRHRRPPKPRGWRSPRPLDGYWDGGYVTAMTEIASLAAAELARTGSAAETLGSVVTAATAAAEVYNAGAVPAEWLDNDG
jgi:hypothetical protein